MAFQITLRDRSVEIVDEADTFAHEKVMTTFYRTANERRAVDCWSAPIASFRTDEILMVRRVQFCAADLALHGQIRDTERA